MIIGVIKEARPGETRVAATPATIEQLLKLGYEVVVEAGAGEASSFADEAYLTAGASCYRPRYLNTQRLNYLWTIRHGCARTARRPDHVT